MSGKFLTIRDVWGMDYETLQTTLDTEEEDVGRIDGQLEMAKSRQLLEGIEPDVDWIRRATSVLKIKRRLIMKMQQRAKQLRKEGGGTVADRFMTVARTLLSDESFNMILESAIHMPDSRKEVRSDGYGE
jgi:hypothetical protein